MSSFFETNWVLRLSITASFWAVTRLTDLYYKKFPTKRRYFSLWQSKQLKHSYRQWKRASVITNFIWWPWFLYWRDQFVFVYEPSRWRYHLMWNFSIPNIQNLHFLKSCLLLSDKLYQRKPFGFRWSSCWYGTFLHGWKSVSEWSWSQLLAWWQALLLQGKFSIEVQKSEGLQT